MMRPSRRGACAERVPIVCLFQPKIAGYSRKRECRPSMTRARRTALSRRFPLISATSRFLPKT